jgi:NAD(P)-dependent dehydrogenase (short-subunit alcohol dehydrogenase family)
MRSGRRLLVVGASAGIGREVARAALARGHDVAVAARRRDRLDELDGARALTVDVCDAASVTAGVAAALDHLGGLDAVVYAAGIAQLSALRDVTADDWRAVFETNVVGAATVAHAVAGALAEARGVMFVCSSTTDEHPRWGLGAYGVSKVALNRLVDELRAEHAPARFVRATLGPTTGTEFAAAFDGPLMGEAFARWMKLGQHSPSYMAAADLAVAILGIVDLMLDHPGIDVPKLNLEPPHLPE